MKMGTYKFSSLLLLSFFAFAVLAPSIRAHIGEFDEVWQKRAEEAQKAALEAYQPNPEEVTNQFNKNVRKSMQGTNTTRRNLRSNKGPCMATNPIDRCWRCKQDWAKNRKKLADCVLGFGRRTTGGKDGEFYLVTDASDNDMIDPKPGTLRHAVIQKEPLWIIFARDMIIRLKQELIMAGNKTIDGRGANVHIAYGCGITIQFVKNIIIHNLHIHDIVPAQGGMIRDSVDHYGLRTASDGDGVSIFGSSNVWVDHLSMSNCKDGLVDVIMASTAITISNCHFTNHNEVMLFGGSNNFQGDKIMQVTVAFNHYGRGLVQRMPRCRYGFVHVVNNDYTHWLMYAIGGSQNPTIISQGNRFIAPPNMACKEVTKRDYASPDEWKSWTWISQGDLLQNGAFFVQSGDPKKKHPFTRYDMIKAKPGTFVNRLTRFSGSLGCKVNQPC
ncbi:pectate lyase-like [Vitis riparia]|uniref:pectate lyase-like n=1 Tax=Vitis riparia TaxID=96939 RepID=UPI00155B1DA9|nr:pectate lyase-like [Vitis riparia]